MSLESFMMRKLPVWLMLLMFVLMLGFSVFFGWYVVRALHGDERLTYRLRGDIISIADFPSLVKRTVDKMGSKKIDVLVKNRFPEIDGFKKNGKRQPGVMKDNGYLLLSSYSQIRGQTTVRLIRIRDGAILHEWVPDIEKLKKQIPSQHTAYNTDDMNPARFQMIHPLLTTDGSIVFKNNGPLFKINACSQLEWVNGGYFHHSIEQNDRGELWVPSHIEFPYSHYKNYAGHVLSHDDSIAKISKNGKLLFNKSVSMILLENGYRWLLFGVRQYEEDAIHLNSIEEAKYSTKYWHKGDLLVSARHLSAVFIYRPSTNKIIWLKTGPWLNQHDADFVGQSKISVFGNDVIRTVKGPLIAPPANNIYIYNFADGSVTTPYAKVLKKYKVMTPTQGRQKILANGDVFVEETDNGRILRLSPKGLVWEFTDKVGNDKVSIGQWSRYLTQSQVDKVLPALKNARCGKGG